MILRTELAKENWERFRSVKLKSVVVKHKEARERVKRENLKGVVYYLYCYMCRSVIISLRKNVQCPCPVCNVYVNFVDITKTPDNTVT